MEKLSKYETTERSSNKCPFCKEKIAWSHISSRYLDASGKIVHVPSEYQLKRAKYEECPSCLARWPIFARDEGLIKRTLVEDGRTEEPVGYESRQIENSTSASIRRTIRASREWTYQIEYGHIEESRSSVESKIASTSISLTTQMQKSIQEHYSITVEEKQVLVEEIVITVPANTSIEIILKWKRIWQNGHLEPGMGYQMTPFRYCVGLTFDLQQLAGNAQPRSRWWRIRRRSTA